VKSIALPGLVHLLQDGPLLGDDQTHSNPSAGAVSSTTGVAEDDHQHSVEKDDQEPQHQQTGDDH